MSPPGAGRSGAFDEAERQSGIPVNQQPIRVLPNVDKRGDPQPGKIYEFEVPASGGGTRTVRVREDAGGHDFGAGNSQNREKGTDLFIVPAAEKQNHTVSIGPVKAG
jgi:filamentous hemagglutinin